MLHQQVNLKKKIAHDIFANWARFLQPILICYIFIYHFRRH